MDLMACHWPPLPLGLRVHVPSHQLDLSHTRVLRLSALFRGGTDLSKKRGEKGSDMGHMDDLDEI